MIEQSIPCPHCQDQIPFDVQLLIQGASFQCPTCDAKITLPKENLSTVQDSMKKLEELKRSVPSKSKQ